MKLPPEVKKQLIHWLGTANVQTDETALSLYGYDCSLSRTRPDGVLLLTQTAQISPVLQLLYRYRIPFVVRASATNHAGSCAALKGGFILNVAALNRILEINTRAGFAIVEPGVITGDLQAALAPLGFFYAPDPASQAVSTLGGNLAQNASGARCMKYGGTLDHVLEAQVVLPDGTPVTLSRAYGGPDWLGLLAGSEGTLGVITQLKVKILPLAKHIRTFLVTFPSLENSVQAVSALVAQGIIPRCVEAMDQTTTCAVEAFAHAGYPTQAAALLLLELDGTPTQIQKNEAALKQICNQYQALHFIPAKTAKQRADLWRGRQSAYAAMARLAPNVLVGDGTVPRSELPRALARVQQILIQNKVRASLLFHAGDGNFHPQILCDQRQKLEVQLVSRVLREILQVCIDCGGTVSGEHGIGVEKRALLARQYDVATLDAMARLKHALDPKNLANPLKILPYQFKEKASNSAPVPANIQELQHQLTGYNAQQTPYVIAGLNTQLKTRAPVLLSAKNLNQIVEIDKANYTVTVQAGVSLIKLKRMLSRAGVYISLPATDGSVGGAFCSGKFPEFYAQVTGIEALLPDGSYVRYGGKLMKNAAGYPLTRLFAGSQGSFGLVTQLTFKIFAVPQRILKPRVLEKQMDHAICQRVYKAFNPTGLLQNTPVGAGYD